MLMPIEELELMPLANDAHTGQDYMCPQTSVGFNEVQLIVDYLLPPSSVINNFLAQTEKQGGYRFEFPEISVVKKKITAVPVSKQPQEIEHRLVLVLLCFPQI